MTEFDDNRIAVQNTEWTRMQIRANEIYKRVGGAFVKDEEARFRGIRNTISGVPTGDLREEVRMTEETAMRVKELSKADLAYTFGAALGIPVTITDAIPPGKAQIWRNGEIVVEFDV